MNTVKRLGILAAAISAVGMACIVGWNPLPATAADATPPQAVLANADCVKCHQKPVETIEAKGQAHKTAVSCQDCHAGHPPAVKKIIPHCSTCHSEKPHYKLPGCLGCHRDPHAPKDISFGRNVTDPCLTCHTQQIAQLKEYKSKHSALACSFCHDVHGKIPACTQCHKPHSTDMTADDCKKCHKAHMPKVVTYTKDTPNKFCAACHTRANALLSASKSKHSKVSCVSCHQEKHKTIMKCQDCHGTPHPATIMAKFAKCSDCHNIAHDLNHWSAEKKEEPKKKPVAPKKK